MTTSEYELQRLRNIEKNKEILKSLGISDIVQSLGTYTTKPPKIGKEKKSLKTASKSTDAKLGLDSKSLRRSQRNIGKAIATKNEKEVDSESDTAHSDTQEQSKEPRSVLKRVQNPKRFGHIPGVPVGSWWYSRELCSLDAVHAPWVAGISCSPRGAYSVALSGGYVDDVDLGYTFTYTGSGGRDLKGTKDKPKNLRTAPQSSDQTFENRFNKAIQMSVKTKEPVRVVRGFKLDSPYAPSEGYRYDGLYTVEKAWQQEGLDTKYVVCKFAFKRIGGQPAIPLRQTEPEQKIEHVDKNAI